MEDYLAEIYYSDDDPDHYSNPRTLFTRAKKDGKNFKLREIEEWCNRQEIYSIFKPMTVNIENRPIVIVPRVDYQWDADSLYMRNWEKDNKGYAYILNIIDIFSRFAWSFPLKTLQASETEKVLSKFLQDHHCDFFRSDYGSEFKSVLMKKLLDQHDIEHIVTRNEPKANYCERLNRTLKETMLKIMTHENSNHWLDDLDGVVRAYNHSYHSSIRMTPYQARRADTSLVWRNQYLPKPVSSRSPPTKKSKKPKEKTFIFKFAIGDTVRVSRLQEHFRRAYEENWSHELFTVVDRKINQGHAMYTLMSWLVKETKDKKTGEKTREKEFIDGDFYEKELQKVDPDFNPVYRIAEVLKERTVGRGKNKKVEVLVSWLGWHKKFNQWIPKDSLEDV